MLCTMPLSDCLKIVWVDPVSAHACAEAVKLAVAIDSIELVTSVESMTCANFTAASYDRVLWRFIPGVEVDPLGTAVGVFDKRCASVYVALSAHIFKHVSPLCELLYP